MNRRGFLKGLFAAAAVQAFDIPLLNQVVDDPERLLWVPGQKTYFLPPDMSRYSLVTVETITREAFRIFHGQLAFADKVNRQYDAQFSIASREVGDTVRVSLRPLSEEWLKHSRRAEMGAGGYFPNVIRGVQR